MNACTFLDFSLKLILIVCVFVCVLSLYDITLMCMYIYHCDNFKAMCLYVCEHVITMCYDSVCMFVL